MITEEYLAEIEKRWAASQPGEWKAYIEGRDHLSGNHFIMTGVGQERGEDIELVGNLKIDDYEFIANAKQDIPLLVAEVRRMQMKLRQLIGRSPNSTILEDE